MTATVSVLPLWQAKHIPKDEDTIVISTVAKNTPGLSPFCLGPCSLYDSYEAQNMENAWQFSKVYEEHWNANKQQPRQEYWNWAIRGWDDKKAHRYPMGKGRKPVCSWWIGRKLDYVAARKTIYGPLYIKAVQTHGRHTYNRLRIHLREYGHLILLDYDAYDHKHLGMSLTDVLNDPKRKMGHAFVLAMLLTNDPALNEMELR
jgi:hypothetical protein